MGTTRIEAFSDGVFAIAATLLILDVHRAGGSVSHGLLHAWPSYTAYAISFMTIGIIWVNHHTVMDQIGRIDRTFMFINLVLLMIVSFSPYPTRVLAETLRSGSTAAAFDYGATFVLMSIAFVALWLYATHNKHLLSQNADPKTVSGITRAFRPGTLMYTTAMLSSLISAYLAVALYGAIALVYVVESSLFGRNG